MKFFRVWSIYTVNSFQQTFASRFGAVVLVFGKIIRIGFFIMFLSFLFSGTKQLGTYNREQIIFFYLTFNLIDTLGQIFFREVYRFRDLVVKGNLDSVLTKPVNPLVRVLLGGFDPLDAITLLILIPIIIFYAINYLSPNLTNSLIYISLIINSFLIAASFHIFVLGLGIITVSVDHIIFIYRDLTNLLRIPVDIYKEPVRAILTFLLPLGIMLTFPAKALMGLLSPGFIILSFGIGLLFLFASLKFWKYSLRYYQSASS